MSDEYTDHADHTECAQTEKEEGIAGNMRDAEKIIKYMLEKRLTEIRKARKPPD